MGVISNFIWSQLFVTPTQTTQSYAGKNVIVTGSNTGLGKEAAKTFARLGAASVILAVRSIEKGEAAKQEIETEAKCGAGVVKVWPLDMASYQSVLDFSARVEQELPRLDVALLNAGIAAGSFRMAEKDEATITVNVVSTFLLALLLLPKLKETANKFNIRPTLTITASEVHMFTQYKEKDAPVLFDRLNENYPGIDMGDRYQVSKLLDVLGTRAMADRKSASQIPVTINCVNPGLCHSELSREAGIGLAIMKFFFARSTEVGSRTLVHAASAGPETHGQYMSDCEITPPAKFVLSHEGYLAQNKMWNELAAKLEDIKPGVTKNL